MENRPSGQGVPLVVPSRHSRPGGHARQCVWFPSEKKPAAHGLQHCAMEVSQTPVVVVLHAGAAAPGSESHGAQVYTSRPLNQVHRRQQNARDGEKSLRVSCTRVQPLSSPRIAARVRAPSVQKAAGIPESSRQIRRDTQRTPSRGQVKTFREDMVREAVQDSRTGGRQGTACTCCPGHCRSIFSRRVDLGGNPRVRDLDPARRDTKMIPGQAPSTRRARSRWFEANAVQQAFGGYDGRGANESSPKAE